MDAELYRAGDVSPKFLSFARRRPFRVQENYFNPNIANFSPVATKRLLPPEDFWDIRGGGCHSVEKMLHSEQNKKQGEIMKMNKKPTFTAYENYVQEKKIRG